MTKLFFFSGPSSAPNLHAFLQVFFYLLTILKVVAKESAASDPYSIINYGLGGQIEVNIVCIALDLNVLTIPGTR